jgi:hypothetical protein
MIKFTIKETVKIIETLGWSCIVTLLFMCLFGCSKYDVSYCYEFTTVEIISVRPENTLLYPQMSTNRFYECDLVEPEAKNIAQIKSFTNIYVQGTDTFTMVDITTYRQR